jgi:antitoxin component YwqK of YwqJK toxin-antitoxin module
MKGPVLLLLFLAGLARGFPDELLYRSNAIGMRLEAVAPFLRDSSRWILAVERIDQGEVRHLFDNGKEVRKWVTAWLGKGTRREEREYSAGAIAARRVFDESGNLLQEETYNAGTLSQKSLYTYTGNQLTRMRSLAPDGSLLTSERYVYAVGGALREVRRTAADGEVRFSSYVAGRTGVSEERNSVGDVLSTQRYDTQGRLVSREQRRGDDVLVREDFLFRPDSAFLLSSREAAPAGKKVTDRRYDEAGRLISETTTEKGAVVEEIVTTRDEKGRVTVKTRRTPAGLETWKYVLDDAGKVARESYFRLGSLVKVSAYGPGKQRAEELYKDEEMVLKAWFDGDTRLREEVYSGGTLVRERKYQ